MKKKAAVNVPAGTTIQNCQFYGIKWDKAAMATVQTVADALLVLAKLFSQTPHIETMVSIGAEAQVTTVRDSRFEMPKE